MSSSYEEKCHYSKCNACGSLISWQLFSKDCYAYKLSGKGPTKYACSYTCFKKVLEKYVKPKKKSNFEKVIELMGEGMTDEEIAKDTGLALVTVKCYISKSDCCV